MKKILLLVFMSFFFLLGNINAQTCQETGTVSGTDNTNPTITFTSFPCAGGATIIGLSVNASFTGTWCPSWYAFRIIVNGNMIQEGLCNVTNYDLSAHLPVNLLEIQAYDTDVYGDFITLNATVNVTYVLSGPFLITAPNSLNFGYVPYGSTSASQQYAISGDNLTAGPITVTAPPSFEVSLDNSSWVSTVDVTYTAPTLTSTPVYVRFTPGAANTSIQRQCGQCRWRRNYRQCGCFRNITASVLCIICYIHCRYKN
jgi:hypothetical protein